MGFPIAIGSKSISLLPIFHTNTVVPNQDDEEDLYSVFSELSPRLSCFSTCSEGELQAVVSTVCGDMVCKRTGIKQLRFTEVRVRISLLQRPLSKIAHRESVFRIPLEIAQAHNDTSSTVITNVSRSLQAVFSFDRRFLACLVPIDDGIEESLSIVVVFRLRLPRKTFDRPLPPTPSYIHTSKKNDEIDTPFATSPRVLCVASDDEQPNGPSLFFKATCLCNMRIPSFDTSSLDRNDESSVLLLVGCFDGSVVAASYHTGIVSGQLIHPSTLPDPHVNTVGIKCMDQITIPTLPETEKGSLCLLDDGGKLSLYDMELCADKHSTEDGESHLNIETPRIVDNQYTKQDDSKSTNIFIDDLVLKVTKRQHYFEVSDTGRIVYAIWMTTNNMLAVWFQQHDSNKLYVLSCSDQEEENMAYPPLVLRVLSQISLNHERVKESAHTRVLFESAVQDPQSYDQRTPSPSAKIPFLAYSVPIQYEPISQCFVINVTGTREAFALLWHWKSNTQGLSIYKIVSSLQEESSPEVSLISCLRLAREKQNPTLFLADITFLLSNEFTAKQLIRKDLYEVGILSPLSESRLRKNGFIDFNSPIFLTAKTLAFPRSKRRSIRDEYELEWIEACLPAHVRSPGLSAIGRRWGRSIAIACEFGFCIVDVGGKPTPHSDARRSGFRSSERSSSTSIKSNDFLVAAEKSSSDSSSAIPMQGRDCPKWYQFGNDLTANSFQVVGFSWWEGCEVGMSVHDCFFDDVLVAVLRTHYDGNTSFFLSCWSKSKLDLDHQLLNDLNDACPSKWGVKLAPGFTPTKLSVFGQPKVSRESSRKAYVLLSSDNDVTDYLCLQLQMNPVALHGTKSRNYLDTRPYHVLGVLASQGSIGGPADIFITGANFDFNLLVSTSRVDTTSHLVTIGVARELGTGLDAMALSRNGVSHFGEVITSCCADARSSSVSSMWQSWSVDTPASTTLQPTSVWVIHLLDDSIVTWIVPSFVGENGENECEQESNSIGMESGCPKAHFLLSVHAASCILGWMALSGRASDWMQAPSKTTSMDFPLGPLQLGSTDCMIGVNQHCHKLHRAVDENNESLLFRCDFLENEIFAPGAFRIKPPGFLPAFFSIAKQMTVGDVFHGATILQNYSMRIFNRSTRYEASMLALQVFFLRVLEKLTSAMDYLMDPNQRLLQNVLATSVDIARTVFSPLHFSMLFLEVGRQIEPGCFGNLFPLSGLNCAGRHEEVLDLFDVALDQGALDIATATLPLLSTQQVTTQYCHHILRELLRQLVESRITSKMGFNLDQDMRITGDLFRYVLKISDEKNQSNTLHYQIDDEEETRRPSVFCALSNFFIKGNGEAKIEKAAATFIISGFEDDYSTSSGSFASGCAEGEYSPAYVGACKNVACCAIDALTDAILHPSKETDWRLGALTARVLIGLDGGERKLTPENQISRKIATFTGTTQLEIETGGILHFLKNEFTECRKQIKPGAASLIVDLIVFSCGNLSHQKQISNRIILVLLVCLHCSERSQQLLDSVTEDAPLVSVFRHAALLNSINTKSSNANQQHNA